MPTLLALALVISLAACAPAPPPPSVGSAGVAEGLPPGPNGLDAARALWEEAGLDGYTMTVSRSCFCPPEYRGPFAVTVEDGETTGALYDGRPAEVGDPPTVEALFALLAEAYARGAARVDVTYDPALGYPTSLYIDRDERIADEEVGYEVTDLIPR